MPNFLKEKLKWDYCIVIKCKALFKCFVANKRHFWYAFVLKNFICTSQTLFVRFVFFFCNLR